MIDINRRNQAFFEKYGKTVKYKNLPKDFQTAIAYYMAVEGSEWTVNDWTWGDMLPDPVTQPDLRRDSLKDLEESLSEFIKEYGELEFAVIYIPTTEFVQNLLLDKNYDSEKDQQILEAVGDEWEYNIPTWPVILSSVPDQTVEDGNKRLSRYRHLNASRIPCIGFIYED